MKLFAKSQIKGTFQLTPSRIVPSEPTFSATLSTRGPAEDRRMLVPKSTLGSYDEIRDQGFETDRKQYSKNNQESRVFCNTSPTSTPLKKTVSGERKVVVAVIFTKLNNIRLFNMDANKLFFLKHLRCSR